MNVHDPFVVFTDFAITILCLIFCWRLWARGAAQDQLRRYFFGLFAAAGLAAFLGGLVHGFFDPTDGHWNTIFWRLTLFSVGLSSYNLWMIDLQLLFNERMIRSLRNILRVLFVIYAFVVLATHAHYGLAIVSYIPPALVLLLVLTMRVMRERTRHDVAGLIGLILTFVASIIQQSHLDLHPVYLDHNSLYHVVQGFGLGGIYIFARRPS